MSCADEVEKLLKEYTSTIELSLDFRSQKRSLRCSFCNQPFKYQVVMDEHVVTRHMNLLKTLTDDERLEFLRKYIKDESKMMYPEFHRQHFGLNWR